MNKQDDLYSEPLEQPVDFQFDERVVQVFPDMINRSVPGYGLIVPMIGLLARRFVTSGSRIYDLGCSLGAVSLAIRRALSVNDVDIINDLAACDLILSWFDIIHYQAWLLLDRNPQVLRLTKFLKVL